jgi:hypothetical protein
MSSGESRYSVVSDRTAGTFVTRYYSSSSQDLSLALASPPLKAVAVDRIEYKSGKLPGWAESPQDYIERAWYTLYDSITPTLGLCYKAGYIAELQSAGNEVRIEMQQSGAWVPVGTREVDVDGCTDEPSVSMTLSEQEILGMSANETCNEVRLYEPATFTYRSGSTIYCFFISE